MLIPAFIARSVGAMPLVNLGHLRAGRRQAILASAASVRWRGRWSL